MGSVSMCMHVSICVCVTRTYIFGASQGFGGFVRGALLPFSVAVLASTYEKGEEEGARKGGMVRG
jgi:hypothetical protein